MPCASKTAQCAGSDSVIVPTALRLPATGEGGSYDGWRFEAVDMDGRRIDKPLVRREPSDAQLA
jgi:CBS domain containing-hemolysin-like protein